MDNYRINLNKKTRFDRIYASMKNSDLGQELQDFMDDKFVETQDNTDRFISLLKAIVIRLKTDPGKPKIYKTGKPKRFGSGRSGLYGGSKPEPAVNSKSDSVTEASHETTSV